MKQQITTQQYKRLSTQAKSKLLDWLYKKGYGFPSEEEIEVVDTKTQAKHKVRTTNFCVQLTIGQLIEFLDDHDYGKGAIYWKLVKWQDKMMSINPAWEVSSPTQPLRFRRKELCDALWEAVKEVLESNGKSKQSD